MTPQERSTLGLLEAMARAMSDTAGRVVELSWEECVRQAEAMPPSEDGKPADPAMVLIYATGARQGAVTAYNEAERFIRSTRQQLLTQMRARRQKNPRPQKARP
jgi:hypothetical protein